MRVMGLITKGGMLAAQLIEGDGADGGGGVGVTDGDML